MKSKIDAAKFGRAFGEVIGALPGGFERDWMMAFADRITGEQYETWGADDIASIPEEAVDARHKAQEYWDDVAADIEAAKAHEARAVELLLAGDYDEAAAEIEAAAALERKHGDSGSYDHALNMLPVALDISHGYGTPGLLCVPCALERDEQEAARHGWQWIIRGDNTWGVAVSAIVKCDDCGRDLSDVLEFV